MQPPLPLDEARCRSPVDHIMIKTDRQAQRVPHNDLPIHDTGLLTNAAVTDLSSMECNAWTLRGHHKSGLHAHRAITHDRRSGEGGERWLAPLRKPHRGEGSFDHTFVLIAGSQVSAKRESHNKTYPLR